MKKDMSIDEWKESVKILVESLEGRTKLKDGENHRIFDLHNYAVRMQWLRAPIEHGRSCGACVVRTLGRLRAYYNENLK